MAARAFPISASGVVGPTNVNGFVTLIGWSLRETASGGPATMTLHDGGVVGGTIVGESNALSGDEAQPIHFGPEGIRVPTQLYVKFTGAGTPSAVIYIR